MDGFRVIAPGRHFGVSRAPTPEPEHRAGAASGPASTCPACGGTRIIETAYCLDCGNGFPEPPPRNGATLTSTRAGHHLPAGTYTEATWPPTPLDQTHRAGTHPEDDEHFERPGVIRSIR
jgi:hypothetical protein